MDAFKRTIKITVFLMVFLTPVFSGSLFAVDGLFLDLDENLASIENQCGREVVNRSADNSTGEPGELNPFCFLDAFLNLFLNLLEEEDVSSTFASFFSCLSGCFKGADSCEDELMIVPEFDTVKPGETREFTAVGGTGSYVFSLLRDNSGAALVDHLDGTADYTAGEKIDVTDVVQVKDDNGKTADANILVSSEVCTFLVEPEGGIIKCDSGLSIEFPAGAVESATTCKITLDKTPETFPAGLDNTSQAFNVQLNVALQLPVKITFNNISSSEAGSLGIYVLEDGDWTFAGGEQDGTTVFSYVKDLSLFRVGKSQKLHKAFQFYPYGDYDVNVSVAEYALTFPDQDTLISDKYSIPIEGKEKQTAFFPQGKYRFCVEWFNDYWQYKFEGSAVPASDNHILRETDSLISPPDVTFNLIGGSPGSCPPCENMTD